MLTANCLALAPSFPDEASGRHSLFGLLHAQAKLRPDAPALLGPGRASLSYLHLLEQTEAVGRALASWGIGRSDRVALAMPNGPETAACFLAVACSAACAPLNPACREAEFDFFLSDLKAKAVVVPADTSSTAGAVAEARGLLVLELASAGPEAGAFLLRSRGEARRASPHRFSDSDDVSLLLHTSGTTARPKLVPLRHDALCAAAQSIAASLALTADDRLLNVMPLFHLHALSVLLASVAVGASVACAPPFDADRFFDWLDAFAPTWYSASPTLHQAILERIPSRAEVVARRPLRLIRSTSASLPTPALARLERAFNAPVIEAYAATEAPSQITSNPLSRPRKPGSVGVVTGPEVAILSDQGRHLPPGEVGEVALHGPHVLTAYENNPEANARAFLQGWFRTGDLGYFDADGYLYITGRAREIINKGGEKVAPREVEETLLAHPAVAQAAAFAVPHPRLGEDIGAAVVLRQGLSVGEAELRAFVAARLIDFKVPRQFVFVPDLPKGPTGKVQRIGLAERLGLVGEADPARQVAPRTPTEHALAEIWARALGVERVGVSDDFFRSGGDSLLAARLLLEIEKRFAKRLSSSTFLECPTVEHIAREIHGVVPTCWTSLVPLQPRGSRPPFYLVHGIGGELLSFAGLARRWDADQPLYGLQVPTVEGVARPFDRLKEMAAHYLKEIRVQQPEGPYYLGGFSFGGVVAFEMARQLHDAGQKVALLAVVDSDARRITPRKATWAPRALVGFLANLPAWVAEDMVRSGPRSLLTTLRRKAKAMIWRVAGRLGLTAPASTLAEHGSFDVVALQASFRQVLEAHLRAKQAYVPQTYTGRVTLMRGRARPLFAGQEHDLGWHELAGAVEVDVVPGNHETILKEPHLARLVEALLARLREAQVIAKVSEEGSTCAA